MTTYPLLEPVVAGLRTYSSKYCRTSLSLSSSVGNWNSTISSRRSLIAQSNWSGWLLAKTSINLGEDLRSFVILLLSNSCLSPLRSGLLNWKLYTVLQALKFFSLKPPTAYFIRLSTDRKALLFIVINSLYPSVLRISQVIFLAPSLIFNRLSKIDNL